MMHSLLQDIRFALRSLRKRPLFTAVAVITLALGIGANTAIFSVLDAILLRPLGYDHAEQLVEVSTADLRTGHHGDQLSFPNFRDIRAQGRALSPVAAFRYWLFNLSGKDHAESLLGVYVGDSVFSTLRVRAGFGRLFNAGLESTSAPREAVVSHALWVRRFGADRGVIGTTVVVDGKPTTVIGVLPEGFRFPDLVPAGAPLPSRVPDLYIPIGLQTQNDMQDRGNDNYWVLGRLSAGATPGAANAELGRVAAGLTHDHPDNNTNLGLVATPLREAITGDTQRPLLVLFGAVGLVLLIACANVGGLQLARALERRQEVGIRIALGASQGRLRRQLLTESLVLALIGGATGVLLASWGVAVLRNLAPATIPRIDEVGLDARVLCYAVAGAVIAGLLFGLAPLLQQRGDDAAAAVRESGRTTGGSASRRLRAGLVIAELALAVVLLSGAGLLLRSFSALEGVAPGFDASNVMTMFTLLPGRYANDSLIADYERRVLGDLSRIPGVKSVAGINTLPLSNLGNSTSIDILDHPAATPAERPGVSYRILGGPYFNTMGMHIVAGRDFALSDSHDAPPVAIINEAAARRFFPGESPLGRQVRLMNGDPRPKTIVGVVGDVHAESLEAAARPEISYPYTQGAEPMLSLAIKTTGSPWPLLPAIRSTLGAIDPDLGYYAERTMDDLLGASLATRRFNLELLAGFALLAVVLASIGLYGVIAFSVSQRKRELGIRAALGAERRSIALLVLGEGAKLGALGLGIGVLGALGAGRILGSALFQVHSADPLTLGTVALVLGVVVLVACYLPARRAAAVDPVEALRGE